MRQILGIFVLLAFVFSTSGMSKLVHNQAFNERSNITISQITATQNQEAITKCCANDDEQSENQQPRCIGDICLDPVTVSFSTLGYGNRLPLQTYTYVDTSLSTSLLRPPIA